MRIELILLGVIILVVALDFLVKKRKKNSSSEIEKFEDFKNENVKKPVILKWVLISLGVISLGSLVAYQIVFVPKTYNTEEVTVNNNLAYLKSDMSLLNGKLNDSIHKGLFVDGKKEGNHKFHFFYYSSKDLTLRKLEDRFFFQHIFNDLEFYYYKNDNEPGNGVLRKLREESNYRNGKLEGLTRMWYQNGQLKLDYKYFNEKPANGVNRRWYENGQLRYIHNYYMGTGSIQSFYENGQIFKKDSHTDGKLESMRKWHENGQLISEGLFNNGIKAHLRLWYDNGVQCREISYIGFGDSASEWNKNGKLLYKGTASNWRNIY